MCDCRSLRKPLSVARVDIRCIERSGLCGGRAGSRCIDRSGLCGGCADTASVSVSLEAAKLHSWLRNKVNKANTSKGCYCPSFDIRADAITASFAAPAKERF